MTQAFRFPDGFLWGCATAAYQIEGSDLADGAGASIWRRFSHTPGNVLNGDTGDVACDHYNRWREDIGLMRELGLGAYRFSVNWGRVLPEGKGQVNPRGLDFYDRLVDGLLEAGIEPLLTLYHWDLPAALDDQGGWLNRDIAGWFADYMGVLARKLDGRVKFWATLNEPWVVTDGGYLHGVLAPGRHSLHECALASHNLLRAHGAAVQAYRAEGKHQIGLVVNIEPKTPASDSPEDLEAVRRTDGYMNRQYLDPVFRGSYPPEMAEIFGEAWPDWPAADFDLIRQPLDWIGINYYTRVVTRHDDSVWPLRAKGVVQKSATYTETGWEVYPQGLTETLLWVKERYGDIPLYVTENGSAFYDPPVARNGRINDALRVSTLQGHLKAIHAAIKAGVDLRGYMAWSLLDNLEWSLGYSKRFGIIHVDFETQQRTIKDSGRLYAEVIRTHGEALADL